MPILGWFLYVCGFVPDIWKCIMGLDGCYWMALNKSQKSIPEFWYWSQRNLDSEWSLRIWNMFLASKLINEWSWIIPKIFLTLIYVCHWMSLNMLKPCIWKFHEAKWLNTPGHGAHNPHFISASFHHSWHHCLAVPYCLLFGILIIAILVHCSLVQHSLVDLEALSIPASSSIHLDESKSDHLSAGTWL